MTNDIEQEDESSRHDDQYAENIPYNELDMQYKTTRPTWGREASSELNNRLKVIRKKLELDTETDKEIIKVVNEYMWGLLSIYTQDIRLGNLKGQEIKTCIEYLDIAVDCLRHKYKRSSMAALTRVITIIEVSHSRDGFFRRRLGARRIEKSVETDAPRKNIIGQNVR